MIVLLGALIVAFALRLSSPHSQLTVSAFQLADTGKDAGASGGKLLADLLVDDLQKMLQEADHFAGNDYSSRKTLRSIPDLPDIPVETTYGIEIRGISLDQLLATWNRIRYAQFQVDGDLLRQAGGETIIVVRYKTTGKGISFEKRLPDTSPTTLRDALSDLILSLVEEISPQAAARFLLSKAMSCVSECDEQWRAVITFCKAWAQREPRNYLALYFLGYGIQLSGHSANAIPFYKRSLELDSKPGYAWNALGTALEETGRLAESKQAYLTAVRVDKSANALMNLGTMQLDNGNYRDAELYYKRAIGVDPDYTGALLNLGHLEIKTGNYSDALTAFTSYQNLRPGDSQAVYSVTHSLAKLGRGDEAIQQCEIAAQLYPSAQFPLLYKGLTLMILGRYDEAERALESSRAVHNTLEVNKYLAFLGMYRNNFQDSLRQLNALLDQFPQDASLHLAKADALEHLGESNAAELELLEADKITRGARYDIYRWNE